MTSSDISDWVIVIAHGKTFIGREHFDGTPSGLSPVYELVTGMQSVQMSPREPPQIAAVRQCWPVLTLASVRSLTIEGVRICVGDLSDDERRSLAQSVEGCEALALAMRAAERGIVLAPPGSRIKPG